MTFRDYVFMSCMTKISSEVTLKGIRRIVENHDLVLSQDEISAIYWRWFFEIQREGVNDWNQFVQAQDYNTLEQMLLDFQQLTCSNIITALGDLAEDVQQTPSWVSTVMDVYMSIFGDYVNAMIPDIMPIMKNVLSRNEDEGVSDPISF
jgi:hypothetical protein